jgi:hypothetical protein
VDYLVAILTLVLIGFVVLVVSAPLRRARRAANAASGASPAAPGEAPAASATRSRERDQLEAARDEIEAAREAKYREIRDTELDYRTGKLSREDYHAIDADLRTEALEILDRLERFSSREP